MRRHPVLFASLLLFGGGACATPFSELQSARLAGPGRVEVTGGYSSVSTASQGVRRRVRNHYGVQAGFGLRQGADLRLRYERITRAGDRDEGDAAINVVGMGPKFSIVEDRLAFYIPIGLAFGSRVAPSSTVQAHPTLLITAVLHENIEINASTKALIPVSSRATAVAGAANLGLGLSTDFESWIVRPELGIFFDPVKKSSLRQLSIGLTYYFGR